NIGPTGIISALLTMPATATIYDANGAYTQRNPFENIISNPIASLNSQTNKTKINRLFGTAFGEYTILKGFKAKFLIGIDQNATKEYNYIPSTIYEGSGNKEQGQIGFLSANSWLNENTLSYNAARGKHNFDAIAGFTQQEFRRDVVRTGSQDFVSDDLLYNSLQDGATPLRPFSNAYKWILHSYLARANYNYNSKYFLTASIRTDGSSVFGKNNKWGYFPSAAASWKISSENFFEPLEKIFSDAKIRVSYGATGNQAIDPYQSLDPLRSVTYIFGNNIATGFTPDRIANGNLGWETTNQYNAGLDLGLLNDRISLTVDAYYKKTKDLLLNVEIPWTTGQAVSLQNYGSVQNKGLEFSVNSRNFTGDFKWDTNLSLSLNRNEVLSIGNGASSYISGNYIIQVGQPLGSYYGNVTDGILQTADVAAKGIYTGNAVPKAGDRLYKDINGDGKFTTAVDKTIIGNSQPDFIFGFANNLSYKGFDLSVLIQGTYGNQILNSNKQTLELYTAQQNASASANDRWTPTNPSNVLPRAKLDPAPVFSNRYIDNGSFLRVQNITLGYSIPKEVARRAKLSGLRVFVSGQNILTWTNYTGFDPEVTSGSNVSPGTDAGIYPVSRSINAGIRATF
ncbi:MAG: hypothetical protein JWQ25_2031, partial [Daejeonella sp.]|nr:hypothetical protein [Daejeonella sp.]